MRNMILPLVVRCLSWTVSSQPTAIFLKHVRIRRQANIFAVPVEFSDPSVKKTLLPHIKPVWRDRLIDEFF